MSKYDALGDHLKGLKADQWLASFDDIEAVLGFELPKSAKNYQAWWNEERNPHQPQKLAVRRAGWQVAQINLTGKQILFRRGMTHLVGSNKPSVIRPARSRRTQLQKQAPHRPMKIIMQCAGSKQPDGFFRTAGGRKVFFVARPEKAPHNSCYIHARPDDPSDIKGKTWRQKLSEYNEAAHQNPLHLYPAYQLYLNEIYQRLVERFGIANVFILSAGWGLLRSDFLTPRYDITFSQTKDAYKKRNDTDVWQDYCHLPKKLDDELVFFGGVRYQSDANNSFPLARRIQTALPVQARAHEGPGALPTASHHSIGSLSSSASVSVPTASRETRNNLQHQTTRGISTAWYILTIHDHCMPSSLLSRRGSRVSTQDQV